MPTTRRKTTKKAKLKRVTISLTEEHLTTLRRIAAERNMSLLNLFREAALEIIEDDEDIREVMKAREEDGDSITLEEFERRRSAGKEEYEVALSPQASETLGTVSEKDRQELIKALHSLAENPRPPGAERLNLRTRKWERVRDE